MPVSVTNSPQDSSQDKLSKRNSSLKKQDIVDASRVF